jgi:hypothetical protein
MCLAAATGLTSPIPPQPEVQVSAATPWPSSGLRLTSYSHAKKTFHFLLDFTLSNPTILPLTTSIPSRFSPMMRSSALRLVVLFCGAAMFFLPGCSSQKGGKITGKVVLPESIKLEKDDGLQVTLVPAEPNAPAGGGASKVDPANLTFSNNGAEGKGVAPGKYKVAVTFQPYNASDAEAVKRKKQIDQELAPFSIDKTPLTVELTGQDQNITVDLVNKSVK